MIEVCKELLERKVNLVVMVLMEFKVRKEKEENQAPKARRGRRETEVRKENEAMSVPKVHREYRDLRAIKAKKEIREYLARRVIEERPVRKVQEEKKEALDYAEIGASAASRVFKVLWVLVAVSVLWAHRVLLVLKVRKVI